MQQGSAYKIISILRQKFWS